MQQVTQADEDLNQAVVVVRDEEHPGLRATFVFLVAPRGPGGMMGLAVEQERPEHWQDLYTSESLTVSAVRDLPLVRWQAVARQHALAHARPEPVDVDYVEDRERAIREAVERVHPGLAWRVLWGKATKSERNRLESSEHLARLAYDYEALVEAGVPDPASELARQLDAPRGSVRAWLTRARQRGLAPQEGEQA